LRPPLVSTLFPYTTLFRSVCAPEESRRPALVPGGDGELGHRLLRVSAAGAGQPDRLHAAVTAAAEDPAGGDHARRVRAVRPAVQDRKSTRLNSSHLGISYA